MDNKSVVVVSTWVGAISLIVIGAIFDLEMIGLIFFVIIIFALSSAAFMVFGEDNTQEMEEVENDLSQLRYEVKALHAKIDDIKRLFEE